MTVHKYFHPVCKVSLYIQPIEYITLIIFLCGKYCLIPKHALYLVRLEIQRKTTKTIFIFVFVGVKSALRKYLSYSPHFCHVLVSQSQCRTLKREERLQCLTLEKCSLPPICTSGGEPSQSSWNNFSILNLAPNFPGFPFCLLPEIQALQPASSDSPPTKNTPITRPNSPPLSLCLSCYDY